MKSGRFKAVFLDRDGTLMLDPGYPSKPEQVQLLAGVKQGLTSLRSAGFTLVIVTNQSGIGRGFFTETDFWAVQTRLGALLGEDLINTTYFCPDHPEKATDRRKPGPGMLFEAARDLDVSLSESFMIGDKESDIEAGLNAGVKACVWITVPASAAFAGRQDVWVAPDFKTAVELILSCEVPKV
ncbi:MAG TPA: HAD family hydrolase [Chthoniobacterales bacterium]|nr:HAD family hydrolase [Chthoniobacterales bacterium]